MQYTVRNGACQVITLGHKKGVAIPPLYGHCWNLHIADCRLLFTVSRLQIAVYILQISVCRSSDTWYELESETKSGIESETESEIQ